MVSRQAQFDVGGMACSFCAESIRKAYERTDGVEDVDVSLAHEEVRVTYDDERVGEVTVKDALRDLGYTVRDPDKRKQFEEQQAELDEAKRRMALAGAASLVTAGMMLYMIVVRGSFESQSLAMDATTLALALATMFGPGRYIKAKAYHSLRRGILNQHVLLEAGAFAGLLGGLLGLAAIPGVDVGATSGGIVSLPVFEGFPTVHFFAVAVFITTYHVLSEYTSLIVRTRASRAVQDLLDLRPDTARRVRGDARGDVEEVPVSALEVGDFVRVKPGESLPVDGEVADGRSAVDESVATGESMPEEKSAGDEVIGGSVNRTGTLLVEVTAVGDDAFLEQVAGEIEAARATKPGIVQLADRVLKHFVPAVLALAALSFAVWAAAPLAWGGDPNVQRGAFAALAILVLGYPCALGMATPLALIRGGGKAANRGILMRSADAFQVFPEVDRVVLDKTGTITVGEPSVTEVIGLDGVDEATVVRTAASAEAFSEHPLADAVLDHADGSGVGYPDPETFDSVTGKGVRATVEQAALDAESGNRVDSDDGDHRDADKVVVGKLDWLDAEGVSGDAGGEIDRLQRRGLTVSGVARNGELLGLLGIGDERKNDARATVERMREAGIDSLMITGDDERTAEAVATEVGIGRVMADVLPDQKRDEIARIQASGHRVAMVGDGINDAPALAQADVGIAIGAGTDIAIESADVVLMGDRLAGVMDAREIGTESYRKTRQNLAAAFAFNGVGVAAATTGLVHPVFAMMAMVLSVSAVLANSFAGQLLSGEGVNADFAVREATESPRS